MSGFDERDQLSQELRRRSEQVGGHPIGLDEVKGSARRIQRRRRVAGAVAAMAVVAVAVPVGLNLTGTTPDGSAPVAQPSPSVTTSAGSSPSTSPTPSESPTSSPSATPQDGAVPLTLDGTPAGAPPKILYVDGRTVHTDGATTTLPGRYADVTPYRGGWLAVENTTDGAKVVRIDGTGKVTGTAPGGYRIAVSGDGTQVAWVENGALVRGIASGMAEVEDSQKLPAGTTAEVVGFAAGEVVYVVDGATPSVHVTDLAGHDRVLTGLIGARGASDAGAFVAGETRYNADGTSCWVLRTVSTGKDRFPEQCAWTLEAASPDGRYVMGVPSSTDGIGASSVAVMDSATGDVVTTFKSPRNPFTFVTETAWEDDTHLLAVTYQQGTWQILRLGVDGSVETTVDGTQAADTSSPYHLGTRS